MPIATDLRWPVALAFAWVAGELAHRFLRLPRISAYGIVGFALASGQSGFLPPVREGGMSMLANVALGLVLFELGYRINLRWLSVNPWMGMTCAVEASLTFALVLAAAHALGVAPIAALLIAALAMSTSPAAVLRVVSEEGASGQVTERALHLTAFNCILAVLTFKAIVGYSVLQRSGDLAQAIWHSLLVFVFSASIGAALGFVVPRLLSALATHGRHLTVAFALAVLLLVTAVHSLDYSPVLATLAFGLAARHHRTVLVQPERNFGAIGDLLAIVLFAFAAAALDWHRVLAGAGVAFALVAVRLAAKIAGVTAFAHLSGITWRKGVLTGLALTPISALVLLLLEPSQSGGLALMDELTVLAAMVLALEIAGPVVTQWALIRAGESSAAAKD